MVNVVPASTLTAVPGRGRFDVAAVVGRAARQRDCPAVAGRPHVAPVVAPVARTPRRAAVDRHLHATDDAAPASLAVPLIVTAVPPARCAGRGRRDRRRRRQWCRSTASPTLRPGAQRPRLNAHVRKQIDGRLLHAELGAESAAVVVAVEAPRPLHGAGPEHQRAAAWRYSVRLCVGRARRVGRAVVQQYVADADGRRRQPDQSGGRKPLSRSSSHS